MPCLCGKREVAQVVAHLVWDQRVAGSNPVFPTTAPHKGAVFLCTNCIERKGVLSVRDF